MGKVLKSHWTSSAAFVAAAALVCGPVWANTFATNTAKGVDAAKNAKPPMCQGYKIPEEQSGLSTCNKCKGTFEKWQKKVEQVATSASAKDSALSASSSANAAKNAKDLGSSETESINRAGNTQSNASAGMKDRGTNSSAAQAEFKQCESDLHRDCAGVGVKQPDLDAAQKLADACNDAAKGAGKFADTQKQGAGGMGDMSKMMDMASKAMQAMQAMQQQPEASDVSQPPAAPAEQSYETQVSSMGGKSGSNAPVGFGSADGKSVENELAAVEGGGSGVSGSSTSFRPDDSSSSDMGGPVAASTMGVSGGGGSGAGAGNSSGSSRPAEAMEAAASYNNGGAFEMNMGGGTRMMGLKPSRTDLEAMGGEVTPSEAGVVAEGEGDGRGLASEETAGANEGSTQDGDSVFARVRFKYSVLKGAGRI